MLQCRSCNVTVTAEGVCDLVVVIDRVDGVTDMRTMCTLAPSQLEKGSLTTLRMQERLWVSSQIVVIVSSGLTGVGIG